jgi:hypothetical protein
VSVTILVVWRGRTPAGQEAYGNVDVTGPPIGTIEQVREIEAVLRERNGLAGCVVTNLITLGGAR